MLLPRPTHEEYFGHLTLGALRKIHEHVQIELAAKWIKTEALAAIPAHSEFR